MISHDKSTRLLLLPPCTCSPLQKSTLLKRFISSNSSKNRQRNTSQLLWRDRLNGILCSSGSGGLPLGLLFHRFNDRVRFGWDERRSALAEVRQAVAQDRVQTSLEIELPFAVKQEETLVSRDAKRKHPAESMMRK